ncbi:hypothetical protein N7494_008541 [Penicillium frequentans]|uniref:Major facilitator superfamily (MFS) profile domain-containing protein n=1 Tax=Penicillium frequentans TaxID=3151616 RepID=A0AAD6CPT2_9EURO|nr:hypothetical protein N7494_008541 [Penicillium glabrum]
MDCDYIPTVCYRFWHLRRARTQRYARVDLSPTIFHHKATPSHPDYQAPDLFDELNKCLGNKNAQSSLSRFLIYGQITAGLLGAIATPILSSLSDRIGRRPILACTALGPLFYEALLLFILCYPDSVDMHWLLVGYAMEGLSGTIITAMSTSQAYITDVAPRRDRARLFSYMQAGNSFALAVGPIIAGVLLATFNPLQRTYTLAVCAHSVLFLLFFCLLPESRQPQSPNLADQESSSAGRLKTNHLRTVLLSWRDIRASSATRQQNMAIMAMAEMVMFGVVFGLPSLQLAYPAFLFHWKPTVQSFVMSLFQSWSIVVLVFIFPTIMTAVRRYGSSGSYPTTIPTIFNIGEVGAIKVGLLLQCIGYIGISLARKPGYFIFSSLVVASAAPLGPLLISCLTAHVPSHQSGQLLGLLSFLHAIARVIVPALLNATYSMTVGLSPAPLFLILAVINALLLLASMHIKTNVI